MPTVNYEYYVACASVPQGCPNRDGSGREENSATSSPTVISGDAKYQWQFRDEQWTGCHGECVGKLKHSLRLLCNHVGYTDHI